MDSNTLSVKRYDEIDIAKKPIHPRIKPLYQYLYKNKRISDLNYNIDVLGIFSRDVLKLIKSCQEGTWENMVPEGVADIIKKNSLFGSKCNYTKR